MIYNNIKSNFDVLLKRKYKNIKPIKVYDNIHEIETVNRIKLELRNSKGIYAFYCKNNNKIYIGSSVNLVNRFIEHLKGKKSNLKLQRSILKYGLKNIYYLIFEFQNADKNDLLVSIQTIYLSYFKLKYLFNFKVKATSMKGYKHTSKAKENMKDRFKNYKHPLLRKHHSIITKKKFSLSTYRYK
jgi:group I intron endonuclease